MPILLVLLSFVPVASVPTLSPPQAQAAAAPTFTLAGVDVTGAKRMTGADLAVLAGLTTGQPIAVGDLQAAAERAAASGLFTSLQYRYVTSKGRLTLTFDVAEAERTVPVTFDNFVWMSDDQVREAVSRSFPTFDGMAPPTEGTPALISRALEALLSERRIPGRVAFMPQADLKGGLLGYVFKVEPSPRVCAVEVTGASGDAGRDISSTARELVGKEYSRSYFTSMADATLVDIYRRRGHWRAAFAQPVLVVEPPGCSGVSVTLAVTEGPAYRWQGAEWTGNVGLPTATLDKLLGMTSGSVADGRKINDGLLAVRKAYRQHGFLLQTATLSPRLDDAARTAVFEVRVEEGPQFRMGTVQFVGLAEEDAATLLKRWKLAPGEVFNADYASDFLVKEIRPRRGNARLPELQFDVDQASRIVNVRFVAS